MHTLPKSERLSRQKHIELLFAQGKSFLAFPLRIVYLPLSQVALRDAMRPPAAPGADLPKALVLFSVSKKKFKRAVDRNLFKRRMREAYRLNKALLNDMDTGMLIAFQYIAKESLPYDQIERKLKAVLDRLASTTS